MISKKLNKTIAGYHILMILSAVDHHFHVNEDLVIRDWLVHEFPFQIDLDNQMEVISQLLPEEWESHFLKVIDCFHEDSTPKERHDLLQFAIHLVKADGVITVEENYFLNQLFEQWEH